MPKQPRRNTKKPVKKTGKKLGVDTSKRRYDIPLHKDEGAKFTVLLVALMITLALTMLAMALGIKNVSGSWSDNLKNMMTIEIPASDKDGNIMQENDLDILAEKALQAIEDIEFVESAQILDQENINDAISPWLDKNTLPDFIVMPKFIKVEIGQEAPLAKEEIESAMLEISPQIRTDANEEWIQNIKTLEILVKSIAFTITFFIALITIITITSTIVMRIKIHQKDVELLHLMGAQDKYIAKQFVRHNIRMMGNGILWAYGLTAVVIFTLTFLIKTLFIGNLHFSTLDITIIVLLPLIITTIATLASQQTILRMLSKIP